MATFTVSTGEWLRELREAKGLMPRDMPMAMFKARVARDYIPHERTIWRYENEGTVPHLRYRYGLAQFFEVPLASLWPAEERACLRD